MGKKRIVYVLAGVLNWDSDDEPTEAEDDDDFVQRITEDISLEVWGEAVDIDGWELVDQDDSPSEDENPPVSTLNQEQHDLVVTALQFYVSDREEMNNYENNEEVEQSNEGAAEEARKLLSTMGSKRL